MTNRFFIKNTQDLRLELTRHIVRTFRTARCAPVEVVNHFAMFERNGGSEFIVTSEDKTFKVTIEEGR